MLVGGYYPAAVRLRAGEAAELRAVWQFSARYLHLLSDPSAESISGTGIQILDRDGEPVPVTATPTAGSVWMRVTTTPSGNVLSLVDMRAQLEDRWDAERQTVDRNTGWTIRWPGARSPVAMSPWTRHGAPQAMSSMPQALWRLPSFRRWLIAFDRAD